MCPVWEPRREAVRAEMGLAWSVSVAISACLLPVVGCRSSNALATPVPQYVVRGQVQQVQPREGTVLVKQEAVAGFMPAMTMEYRLEDPSAMSELHRGDQITATLLVDKGPDGPTNLRLTDLDITGQAQPDESVPAEQFHVPSPGELVPNFVLLDQSGRPLSLTSLRGKVVILTFIYTRCPVADYCPRMSRNFAMIDQALAKDPRVYAKTHLLSISFDPRYDTPAVLRSYGGAYTGLYTKENFAHWSFAAPSEAELPAMQHWFDVGVTPAGGTGLQHSLSTMLVGADGRVVAFYPTNEWTVAQALESIHAALKKLKK